MPARHPSTVQLLTQPCQFIYPSILPSIHFTPSDLLPSHYQPALEGKAQSFISISSSPLHHLWHHLQTSCVILNASNPPPLQLPADPDSARSRHAVYLMLFHQMIWLCLKTTCSFLISEGRTCFTATCWVRVYLLCLWTHRAIAAWLNAPHIFQSERTVSDACSALFALNSLFTEIILLQ